MSQLLIPSPTGNTRIFAVIGDPVKQVKAPELLNKVFADEAVDAVMIAVHARPEQLATVIRGLQAMENFSGMLITIPHKFAARDFADKLSLAVQVSGSTNAMRRNEQGVWEADNFDGVGFALGLQRKGYKLAGKRVVLAGGGGAGSSIAVALLQAEVDVLYLQEPDTVKAQSLLARLNQHWPGRCELAQPQHLGLADIVINATPLGLAEEDPLPVDLAALAAGALVADIIMQPVDTRLLRAAKAAGHSVHPGSHMLSEQLGCYRTFFRI
ncbi:shikimate dehydrogenase family protein [Pseudomonas plecoglossicida]|uniref:shikimate dehydrogenase family protein n=1 Tax=Pseudomonas plecoglossicida TaxID=70775 RepID=UPI00397787B6